MVGALQRLAMHCDTDRRKEGRREERKEGGRKEGRNEGRKEGGKEGGKEGRKEGGKERRKEGRMEGRREGRKAQSLFPTPWKSVVANQQDVGRSGLSCVLQNPKVHGRSHNIPTLDHVKAQTDLFLCPTPYFKLQIHTIIPSTFTLSRWSSPFRLSI